VISNVLSSPVGTSCPYGATIPIIEAAPGPSWPRHISKASMIGIVFVSGIPDTKDSSLKDSCFQFIIHRVSCLLLYISILVKLIILRFKIAEII